MTAAGPISSSGPRAHATRRHGDEMGQKLTTETPAHATADANGVSARAWQQWVIIDTETTGLTKDDRIVEVAAIAVEAATMTEVDRFVTLLQPDRDTGATEVHGISEEMVRHSPRFADIAREFARFLDGRVLVAHNLRFDQGFLEREFELAGLRLDLGRGFCTWLHGTKMTLAKSCEAHDITLDGAHRAAADAEATMQLLTFLSQRHTADLEPVRAPEQTLF